jgi:glucose-1-phosphate cytidylyltransferase
MGELSYSAGACHSEGLMKVVILCGGLGTRLREETEFRPKPMVNIGNRPIIWHIMKIYAHYGFKEFVLCLGYKGETIKDYFYHYDYLNSDLTIEFSESRMVEVHNNHDEKGWRITLADTGDKTLKGARLKRVEKYIPDETFMLTYGDGLANVNIQELLKFHKSHGRLVTVSGVNLAARFGELRIKGDAVTRFKEKQDVGSHMVSGGFFVCNRGIFDYLDPSDQCDLEIGALEAIAARGELMVYKHKGFWACMDTLRDSEFLNDLWDKGEAKWKVW